MTWSGKHRPALENLGIYPRPVQEPLPVWIAVGGTPASVVRAAQLGLPLALAIIGGAPQRFARLISLYRQAARERGVIRTRSRSASIRTDSSRTPPRRRPLALPVLDVMGRIGRERGWPPPSVAEFEAERSPRGRPAGR